MTSPPQAGNDELQLNLGHLTVQPVMSMGMRETMATMQIRMKWKMNCKPMMDQRRIRRTGGIVLEIEGIVLKSVMIGQ